MSTVETAASPCPNDLGAALAYLAWTTGMGSGAELAGGVWPPFIRWGVLGGVLIQDGPDFSS